MAQVDVRATVDEVLAATPRAVLKALATVLLLEINRLRARADLLLAEANRARQADGLPGLTEAPLGTVTPVQFVEAIKRQL